VGLIDVIRRARRPLFAAVLSALTVASVIVSLSAAASAAPKPPAPPISSHPPLPRPPRPFVVDSTADEPDVAHDGVCWTATGSCTLRAAVQESGGTTGWSIVVPAGVYPLRTSSPLRFPPGTNVTIQGAGSGRTQISGLQLTRVVDIQGGATVAIDGVSIQTGNVTAADPMYSHWHGAGIHNHGTLVLTNSTLIGNAVPPTPSTGATLWGGGGITNAGTGNATLINVTLYANRTENGQGAAIENMGRMRLNHVTVATQLSDKGQAAVFNGFGGSLVAEYSIFSTDNATKTPNCFGAITWWFSISNDSSCNFPGYDGVDPQLGAFDWTNHVFPIAPTSPAVDAGPLGMPASRDQIGQPRPTDGDHNGDPVEDLGAYESQP